MLEIRKIIKQTLRASFLNVYGDLHSLVPKNEYACCSTEIFVVSCEYWKSAQEVWDELVHTYGIDCMEGSMLFKERRDFYTKSVRE